MTAPLPFTHHLQRLPLLAGASALLLALLVLVGGWVLELPVLRELAPGWATMKASTAFGLMGAGAALCGVAIGTAPGRRLARGLALLPLLIGGFSLIDRLSGQALGFDHWLAVDGDAGALAQGIGQPSGFTALALLLLGGALLLPQPVAADALQPAQWMALAVLLIAYVGVLGYLFDVPALYGIGPYASMALHTALLLALLALGVLAAAPRRGLMAIITGRGEGGQIARHLLPAVVLAPPVLGYLILAGATHGAYSLTLAVGLLAAASTLILCVLVLLEAHTRERLYRERLRMVEQLHRSNATLDAAVSERTALLRAIMDSRSDLIAALDGDFRFLDFNRSYQREFERVFGSPIAAGSSLASALTHLPDERQRVLALWARALQGESFVETQSFGDPLRKRRTYEFSFSPLRDSQGRLFGATQVVRDITRQLQEQAERQRAAAEIEELYHHAPCGYHSLDGDGVVLNINDTELAWLGYSRAEVVGKLHFATLLAPASRDHFNAALAAFQREGQLHGLELELRGRRDFPRTVLLNAEAVRDAEGRLLRSRSTLFDITDLRLAERKFASLLEAAPDGVVITDAAGTIVLVNGQAEGLFGYPRDELLGQTIELLVPERLRHRHVDSRRHYTQAPTTRPMGAGNALFGRRKNGEEFPTAISLSSVATATGLLVLSSIRDISNQHRHEIQIQRLNQQLEQQLHELALINRELESFSYSVSHDLRAPLRAIDGFSQALIEDYGEQFDDTGRDYLTRIRGGAQLLGQLIDDLLNLSRINRGDLQRAPLSLSTLAEQVVVDLRAANPSRAVTVTIEPGLDAVGDLCLIRVALTNLLGNAWKFTAQKKLAQIEFGHKLEEQETVYFIKDNGVGFDMAYKDKLFGAFQRLHDQRDFPGSGIGLATVQRVSHRHGGRIWVESTPGQGATFLFTLTHRRCDDASC